MERLLPIFIFLFLSLPIQAQSWSGVSECGLYQVKGVVHSNPNGPVIVVNEKSQSEIIISVPLTNEAKLAPYLNRAMVATIQVLKKPIAQSFSATIKAIQSRIPNPLSPQDTGIKIISKEKCQ
jgi:hypothetical protein